MIPREVPTKRDNAGPASSAAVVRVLGSLVAGPNVPQPAGEYGRGHRAAACLPTYHLNDTASAPASRTILQQHAGGGWGEGGGGVGGEGWGKKRESAFSTRCRRSDRLMVRSWQAAAAAVAATRYDARTRGAQLRPATGRRASATTPRSKHGPAFRDGRETARGNSRPCNSRLCAIHGADGCILGLSSCDRVGIHPAEAGTHPAVTNAMHVCRQRCSAAPVTGTTPVSGEARNAMLHWISDDHPGV